MSPTAFRDTHQTISKTLYYVNFFETHSFDREISKMIHIIVPIFLIILLIGLVVSFLQLEFAEKKIKYVEDWCKNKKSKDDLKTIKRFSREGFIKTISSLVLNLFSTLDKISDSRLRIGIKMDTLFILFSLISIFIFYVMIGIAQLVQIIPPYLLPFIIIFTVGPIIAFLKIEFAESQIKRVEDWCKNKKEESKTKQIERFSKEGFVNICSLILNYIFKIINKIDNPKLRVGIKIGTFLLFTSATIISIVFLTIVVVYVIAFIVAAYILLKLLDYWYEYEKGTSNNSSRNGENPLFRADKIDPNYYFDDTKSAIRDASNSNIGQLDRNRLDDTIQWIYDDKGKLVGELDSNYFLIGDDKQAIIDENGNLVGRIETDSFGGRRIIKY